MDELETGNVDAG